MTTLWEKGCHWTDEDTGAPRGPGRMKRRWQGWALVQSSSLSSQDPWDEPLRPDVRLVFLMCPGEGDQHHLSSRFGEGWPRTLWNFAMYNSTHNFFFKNFLYSGIRVQWLTNTLGGWGRRTAWAWELEVPSDLWLCHCTTAWATAGELEIREASRFKDEFSALLSEPLIC